VACLVYTCRYRFWCRLEFYFRNEVVKSSALWARSPTTVDLSEVLITDILHDSVLFCPKGTLNIALQSLCRTLKLEAELVAMPCRYSWSSCVRLSATQRRFIPQWSWNYISLARPISLWAPWNRLACKVSGDYSLGALTNYDEKDGKICNKVNRDVLVWLARLRLHTLRVGTWANAPLRTTQQMFGQSRGLSTEEVSVLSFDFIKCWSELYISHLINFRYFKICLYTIYQPDFSHPYSSLPD